MSTRRRSDNDPGLQELLNLSQRVAKRARTENGDDVISSSEEDSDRSDIDEPSELDAPLPADEDG